MNSQLESLLYTIPEPQKRILRTELAILFSYSPTLKPSRESYMHNDGSSSDVIALNGTVPIFFHGATYNIPMSIYLPPKYPTIAPKCFVRPTSQMVVKPNHPIVDSNGECSSLPYLRNWSHTSCNLTGLVKSLADYFGIEPPLFSVSSAEQRDLLLSGLSLTQQSTYPMARIGSGTWKSQSSSSTATTTTSQQQTITVSSVQEKRNRILNQIKKRAAEKLTVLTAEIEGLLAKEAELDGRSKEIQNFITVIVPNSIIKYDEFIQSMAKLTEETDKVVEESKHKAVSVDEIVKAFDPLSQQLLNAIAEDAALEDTMFILSRKGVICNSSDDSALKLIRSCARDQFLARALAKKIFSLFSHQSQQQQQQQQQNSNSPYPPPPPYPGIK